jgi:nucleoside-diphosphate-sugar epimerase
VTGGSGFIGQNLVKELIKKGSNVFVVDSFSYNASRENVDKKAIIIEADIRDKDLWNKLPDVKFDYLFHFAAPSSITLFNRNEAECIDITINGFLNAINFCSENKIRIIYPSSGSVYSGTECPQSEKTLLKTGEINSYARAKLALEYIQNSYKGLCDSLGLRIFAAYGPSERHKGDFASVIYLFCEQMMNDKRPVIFGEGSQKRDFVFIDDLVEAILILSQEATERIVNIGSGENVSFNEIVNIVNKLTGNNIKAEHIEKPNVYLEETLADISIMKKYGLLPKSSLEDGIKLITDSLARK